MFRNRRQNRRKKSPEERRLARRKKLREWGRRLAVGFGLVAIAAGLPFAIFQGYAYLMESDYFSLAYVDVEGLYYVEEDVLLEAAEELGGEHILDVQSEHLQVTLKQLPFVADAHVERRFPDRLHIVIEEYEPMAIVVDERFWLVDVNGDIFLELDTASSDVDLWQLPLITGLSRADLETERGQERLEMGLQAYYHYRWADLHEVQSVSEIHVDESLGVTLIIGETGTEVRLGSGRWEERMERLQVVQSSLIQRGLDAAYVLIDHENELNRVAVGQRTEPGTGEVLEGAEESVQQ